VPEKMTRHKVVLLEYLFSTYTAFLLTPILWTMDNIAIDASILTFLDRG